MKIGLLGLTFASGNKGCEALSYSCLEMLNQIAKKRNIRIDVYMVGALHLKRVAKAAFIPKKFKKELMPQNNYKLEYPHLNIDVAYYKVIKGKYRFLPNLAKCDFVIDYTAGDSFTDIYGEDRFYSWTNVKKAIVDHNINLIMGSQTIGPFKNDQTRKFASEILNRSKAIFVRDELSYEYTRKICKKEPILTTDVAFLLPYKKVNMQSSKKKIGFNPSGLLWNGGYTGSNEFGLTVDYQKYCRTIISECINKGYEVHLILHAYYPDITDYPDNDTDAVKKLHKEFPETIVSPNFKTPMEAKGYIAAMDLFIGARMHATIAAFSAGVAVIPFSYSRKFEGLYDSLKYPYVVHGCQDTTSKAIESTFNYIENIQKLQKSLSMGRKLVEEKNKKLLLRTENVLFS